MAENYMNYHDGSPYDERILLDQKVRSLMLGCHEERIKDDGINNKSYNIQSRPEQSEYSYTTPTRVIKQERENPNETQKRNVQRRRPGSPPDMHALSYESNDASSSSQSPIRKAQMCEDEYKQSMLPNYRNRLVQHQVRRLRRQAQRQAGTTGESVSSSSSSPSSTMNIQPSQVKLIKEDRRRKHMEVTTSCAAMKVGMTDIVTATSSLSSSSKEVLEGESSQQLRECLIRARFRIHTSRALLASHSLDSADCQLQETRTNSVPLNVSPDRNKPNNISAPSTPSTPLSKTTLLQGRYADINLTPEQRYRKSSMVDPKFSTTRSRSVGLSNYHDLEDKWAQNTGDLPSLSTAHTSFSPSHHCVNNSMTVMQDGSIQRVVNKGRSKSIKSEPVSSSVPRSFAFDPFPTSASSENTLWDNDATWTAPSYIPGSLFPLFNEYQKDDETKSHQLLVHEVHGTFEDDLCSKVTVNTSNVVHPITKITVVTTNITATTNSSSDVKSKSIKRNVFNILSERRIPLLCKQNSQDCSSSSNNEPRSLSTDQASSRSSSSCDNPASPVNRGRLASVRKVKESSRRHRSNSSSSSTGNTDPQDQDFRKAATTVTRNLVTSCSKSKADNKEWLRSANASERHVQPRSCSNSMEMVFYDEKQEDKTDNEQQQQQQ